MELYRLETRHSVPTKMATAIVFGDFMFTSIFLVSCYLSERMMDVISLRVEIIYSDVVIIILDLIALYVLVFDNQKQNMFLKAFSFSRVFISFLKTSFSVTPLYRLFMMRNNYFYLKMPDELTNKAISILTFFMFQMVFLLVSCIFVYKAFDVGRKIEEQEKME